jgi:multisubunit Na+/H+ antiporter MnhE subunit
LLYQGIFPPEIKIFLWLLLQGDLSTRGCATGFLTYRKIIIYDNACCSFCYMETENINHLIIHCYMTWKVLEFFYGYWSS